MVEKARLKNPVFSALDVLNPYFPLVGFAEKGALCGDEHTNRQSITHSDLAPYDVIHVGAAAPILPLELVDQLAQPGRMFIPIGDGLQDVWQIDKDTDGTVRQTKLFGVRVSHLTSSCGERPHCELTVRALD